MCRLAYVPTPNRVGRKRLEDLFCFLEEQQGGHGNGLANTRTLHVVKGLTVECEKLAAIAARCKSPVVFHTRMASCGDPSDKLCHPFVARGQWNGIVAHNGHWHTGATIAQMQSLKGRTISDSQAMAEMVGEFGIKRVLKIGWPQTGVWLMCQNGGNHLVIARSGDLEFDPDTGIWASEFPKNWALANYEIEHGIYHLDMLCPPMRKRSAFWQDSAREWKDKEDSRKANPDLIKVMEERANWNELSVNDINSTTTYYH